MPPGSPAGSAPAGSTTWSRRGARRSCSGCGRSPSSYSGRVRSTRCLTRIPPPAARPSWRAGSSAHAATGPQSRLPCTRRSTTSAPGSASATTRSFCRPSAHGSSAASSRSRSAMTERAATAAVLASHGTASADGQLAVRRLVEAVSASLPFPVLGCHVDVEQPDVPTALAAAATRAERAVVVPLLLSAGFHVFVALADSPAASPLPATVSPALGPDVRLVQVLIARLQEAGYRPGDEVVL